RTQYGQVAPPGRDAAPGGWLSSRRELSACRRSREPFRGAHEAVWLAAGLHDTRVNCTAERYRRLLMKLSLFICISMAWTSTAVPQVPQSPTTSTPTSQNPTSATVPSPPPAPTITLSVPCSPIVSVGTGSVLGSTGISLLLPQTSPTTPVSSSTSS